MIFIFLGAVLLIMKLGGVEPFDNWDWFSIALPFLLAIGWLELIEPWFGLDVKREQLKKTQFQAKVHCVKSKKPQRYRRGSSVSRALNSFKGLGRRR